MSMPMRIVVRKAISPDSRPNPDRKSTRLNSSHSQISYAVFCLKKKKKQHVRPTFMNIINKPSVPPLIISAIAVGLESLRTVRCVVFRVYFRLDFVNGIREDHSD